MNLKVLLASLQHYEASGSIHDLEITGLSYDSRKTKKGNLFAALPGLKHHGTEFLSDAIRAGAVAVLTNVPVRGQPVPLIRIDNPRKALAQLSHIFYGFPSTQLKLFGVTGTNGKTTSTFLLHSVLKQAGVQSGLLGTVRYRGQRFQTPAALTTPESLDLQQLLASMVEEGCEACVMEVSSHSLSQYRVASCDFESAIFTNLTQDHLDYHGTMEDYFLAKLSLFSGEICKVRTTIINVDDPYGERILQLRKDRKEAAISYGFSRTADCRITDWTTMPSGSEITISDGESNNRIRTSMLGKYNAYNLCGVFAAMKATGTDPEKIIEGLETAEAIPGRLERVDLGQPYLLLIDYAHTEDALRQLLETVRPYVQNKLIVLFGCGGDRDAGKRPLMGNAAGASANVVILTSDNPRNEDPKTIMQQIRIGVDRAGNSEVYLIQDRKEAIAYAVSIAREGDALVLAGKGHEDYQIIGDQKLHFDEREILKELIRV